MGTGFYNTATQVFEGGINARSISSAIVSPFDSITITFSEDPGDVYDTDVTLVGNGSIAGRSSLRTLLAGAGTVRQVVVTGADANTRAFVSPTTPREMIDADGSPFTELNEVITNRTANIPTRASGATTSGGLIQYGRLVAAGARDYMDGSDGIIVLNNANARSVGWRFGGNAEIFVENDSELQIFFGSAPHQSTRANPAAGMPFCLADTLVEYCSSG